MFGKRGTLHYRQRRGGGSDRPGSYGARAAIERASHPCVRLLGAGERHANELPSASPLAALQPILLAFPAVGRRRATVEGCAAKMGRGAGAMALPIAPYFHPTPPPFLPLIPSQPSPQLVLDRVQAYLLPACSCIARGDFAFKTTALSCSLPSRPALPCSALLAA